MTRSIFAIKILDASSSIRNAGSFTVEIARHRTGNISGARRRSVWS